jgi:hypothetical protein
VDWTIFLFVALIGAYVAVNGTAIGGSVDALGQPLEAWERAGFRRNRWVWQAFGAFLMPAVLVYSGLYFVRVRPRLVAAAREIAIESAVATARPPVAEALSGPQVDRVKIRMPLSVVGAIALTLGLGFAAGLGLGVLTAGSDGPLIWRELGSSVAAVLLVAVLNMAFGVTLTPRDLVMRGPLRRRVAWSDVVAITQESNFGARYVRLWTRSGPARRLRAPFTQFGVGRRRFDADFAVLQQWWQTHTAATN